MGRPKKLMLIEICKYLGFEGVKSLSSCFMTSV